MSEYRDLHRDAVPSDSLKVQSTNLLHATASATTGGALFVGFLAYRTILTSPSNRHQVSPYSMMDCTSADLPPDPAPISGRVTDGWPRFRAIAREFWTESRIERSEHHRSVSIPAAWMIPWNDRTPADVSTAWPSGIAPHSSEFPKPLEITPLRDCALPH